MTKVFLIFRLFITFFSHIFFLLSYPHTATIMNEDVCLCARNNRRRWTHKCSVGGLNEQLSRWLMMTMTLRCVLTYTQTHRSTHRRRFSLMKFLLTFFIMKLLTILLQWNGKCTHCLIVIAEINEESGKQTFWKRLKRFILGYLRC